MNTFVIVKGYLLVICVFKMFFSKHFIADILIKKNSYSIDSISFLTLNFNFSRISSGVIGESLRGGHGMLDYISRNVGFWMYSYFKSLEGLIFLRTLYFNHKQT